MPLLTTCMREAGTEQGEPSTNTREIALGGPNIALPLPEKVPEKENH